MNIYLYDLDHSLLGQDALKHCPESISMERVEHDDCDRRKTTKFGIPIEQYKSAKWAMIIAIVLMWMQQLSGINAIMVCSIFYVSANWFTTSDCAYDWS